MTPPTPSRNTTAGRAFNDLRNLAMRKKRNPAEYYTLYALEGLLRRLAGSEYAADFILKGGLLMAAFAERRPTRDIDFAAFGFANDIHQVEQRVRHIVEVPVEDGLAFDVGSVAGEQIRENEFYSGVRVKVTAKLAAASVPLHIDVNFGDPIWPEPEVAILPLLLGGELRLRGYPDHMVLAEKIVTAVDRGEQNTRWRDFVDIAAIVGRRVIRYDDIRSAIKVVSSHRGVEIALLQPTVVNMPQRAQPKWAAWRRKQQLEDSTPEQFFDLLSTCLAFTEPVLTGRSPGALWEPEFGTWRDEGAAHHDT